MFTFGKVMKSHIIPLMKWIAPILSFYKEDFGIKLPYDVFYDNIPENQNT